MFLSEGEMETSRTADVLSTTEVRVSFVQVSISGADLLQVKMFF